MKDKLLSAYLSRFFSGTALTFALLLFWLLAAACLIGGVAALPKDLLSRNARLVVIGAGLLGLLAITLAGVAVYAVIAQGRLQARFDAAFLPLGFTRRRYLLRGLQYQGAYHGREVNVYYLVTGGRYARTPDLQLYLTGAFHTRLGVGTRTGLAQLGAAVLRQPTLDLGAEAYPGLTIHPLEADWARRLLTDPAARDLILRLTGEATLGVRGLVFGPEALRLQVRHFPLDLVTPDQARAWLADLLALARLAEALPAPTQPVTASDWERAERNDRGRFLVPAIFIVMTLVVGCPVLVGAVAFAIMALQGFR